MGEGKSRRTLRDIVGRDVRGRANRDESEFLRSPAMLDEFELAVKEMKRSIEQQISRRKAFVARAQVQYNSGEIEKADLDEVKAESLEWRVGALKVLSQGVEGRLDEIKRLRAFYQKNV